jgi:hypothetical protein
MVFRRIVPLLVAFALLCSFAGAQNRGIPSRITLPIDERNLSVLNGNTYPLALSKFDRGTAPSNLPLNRMLLLLQHSPQQETALKSLLEQQQEKSSPNYHAWLSPELFGSRFGPTDQDIQTITSWLGSHGFQVNSVVKGRLIIEFSGTAGQLKESFHTEIHKYEVNGKEHWANASDPAIPSALAPVVFGIVSLHNFPRKPLHHVVGTFSRAKDEERHPTFRALSSGSPLWTTGGGNCGLADTSCYALAPYDFATIYNVLPLWKASSPIDGAGQTIAIVSQSDIYPQDFSNFRKDFGLPPATLNIIYDGANPGKLASQGDELESDLDVEWAGSVAKGATIDLVASATTNTTAGVDLSALYIVDNNLAPVMSESYGACELDMGTAGNQFYNQLWQQAAAEGITAFVATGDSGSAVCDRDEPVATQGLSVSGISSTPYDVAVGGTDFDDSQNPGAYWNSNNAPKTLESAKGYIPETSWNDSCTNSEFFLITGEMNAESDCNDTNTKFSPSFLAPIGGSGGASNCTISLNQSLASCSGGYGKPAWQTGTGVPNDGKRDVPDVSLFAGDGLNASFYVVCETDIYEGCDGEVGTLVAVGGTSASAPTFAGIMAMINQQTQSRQGNANYVFYPLAAQSGASCNSTGTIGGSCIFYDVTVGTNAMPCATGGPDCVTNAPSDQFGVLSGYGTTAGYDLATGLGSVNVANLANNWNEVSFQPTISTLSLNPTKQVTHGSPVNLNLTVVPTTGTGTPTGQASLLTSTGPSAGVFTLSNGSVSTTTGLLPGGSYTVTAHYAGDGAYGASDSSPGIPVTVNPEASTATVQPFTLDQNGNTIPFSSGAYGANYIWLRGTATGQSGQGVPTGAMNFTQTLNGTTTKTPGDPYSLNSEGYALTLLTEPTNQQPPPGAYSIAAQYSGDASFNGTTSPAVNFTITQMPTSVSTDIPDCGSGYGICVLNPGSIVTILASVNANFGVGSLPTGTMTFYSNGTALGPPLAIDSGIIPPIANFSTTQLPLGVNNITEQYGGDTNYSGSASPVNVVLIGTAFTIAANPTTIAIANPGQSGSTTLTFTAASGFTGSTTLSPSTCSNLPPESSCSFSPASLTFTSSKTTASVTLTINTTAPSGGGSAQPTMRGPSLGSVEIAFGLLIAIFTVGGAGRRRREAIGALASLVLMASLLGCGGGGTGSGGGGGGSKGGTPVGNYTGVTVTTTINGLTQSINSLSIDVQ